MYCRNCGTKLEDDAMFCTNCGAHILRESGERAQRVPMKSERPDNAGRGYRTYKEREKMFGTTPMSRTIALVEMCILGALGFAVLYMYFNYPESRIVIYETNTYKMWIERDALGSIGAIFTGGGIGALILWFEYTQIKLYIGQTKITGVAKVGIVTRKFEYYYDEISEVKTVHKGIKIRVEGTGWITLHKIEDKELAVKMLEERIGKGMFLRKRID